MLGSAEGRSEAAGLVVLPGGTQDTILELNPKCGHQKDKVFNFTHTDCDLELKLSPVLDLTVYLPMLTVSSVLYSVLFLQTF